MHHVFFKFTRVTQTGSHFQTDGRVLGSPDPRLVISLQSPMKKKKFSYKNKRPIQKETNCRGMAVSRIQIIRVNWIFLNTNQNNEINLVNL